MLLSMCIFFMQFVIYSSLIREEALQSCRTILIPAELRAAHSIQYFEDNFALTSLTYGTSRRCLANERLPFSARAAHTVNKCSIVQRSESAQLIQNEEVEHYPYIYRVNIHRVILSLIAAPHKLFLCFCLLYSRFFYMLYYVNIKCGD